MDDIEVSESDDNQEVTEQDKVEAKEIPLQIKFTEKVLIYYKLLL